MISCAEAVRRLWDYLEDDVSGPSRTEVDEHLARCRRCCGEAEFADELRGLLAGAAESELPADVARRLEGALDELAATPGSDGAAPQWGGAVGRRRVGPDDQVSDCEASDDERSDDERSDDRGGGR